MNYDDLMYDDHIELSATRSSEEPDRIVRLNRVVGYVCSQAETEGNRKVLWKVGRLHDHKGTLTVTWTEHPSLQEKNYFIKAWMSIIGDGCENVEHESA